MYTKRVQIVNYGPIKHLDIELPFDGDNPKPIVLVGENGCGKNIVVSHIVNELLILKDSVYPDAAEIQTNRVFKLRSPMYIRHPYEWSFARVELECDIFTNELTLRRDKRQYEQRPADLELADAVRTWDEMPDPESSYRIPNSHEHGQLLQITDALSQNCIQYFPPNRFEEPAWLNEEHLNARAEQLQLKRLHGYTDRTIVNYSPLRENQDWLFAILFDRTVLGDSATANNAYTIALQIVQRLMRIHQSARFGVGPRLQRRVTLESATGNIVPNIFQLSSGETALLNLFLSILRDFDLTGTSFSGAGEIRGTAIVDEIDLHLHVIHQHEILPSLIQMFPKVQFIVTTHSPLFVLGMREVFGEDGFALYRLPQGEQISAEEFSEFGDAYQTFRSTSAFSDDVRQAVKDAQNPLVYLEGTTDIKYVRKAADLLGQQALLESIELKDGNGDALKPTWDAVSKLPSDLVPRTVVVVRDCDFAGPPKDVGNRFRRTIPEVAEHPIRKGIENLFSIDTIEKAQLYNTAFIDHKEEQRITIRGEAQVVPEQWAVNADEKTNLCDWLCLNGTPDDFQHFESLLDGLLSGEPAPAD